MEEIPIEPEPEKLESKKSLERRIVFGMEERKEKKGKTKREKAKRATAGSVAEQTSRILG